MSRLLFIALMLTQIAVAQEPPPAGCEEVKKPHLVYTRQPRLSTQIIYKNGAGVEQTLEEGAQAQDWYDGGQPDNFTTADLVYDDRKGSVKDIYNCTAKNELCAAHDAKVSPDATRIVFTVARGTSYREILNKVWGIVWRATSYELWIHDIATGVNTKIDSNARSADWCGTDCLVFASNRDGTYPPWAVAGNDYGATGFDGKAKGLHIYRAYLDEDLKLGPALNIIPHSASCISPSVNLDGTIRASCWNGFGERGYGHTPMNLWWIEQYNGNGGGHRVIMGAHGSVVWRRKEFIASICQSTQCGEGGSTLKVLRGQVPLRDGKFAISNYYRANHQGGLGTIFVCKDSPTEGFSLASNLPGQESKSTALGSGRFSPDCYVATPYGNDQDTRVAMHINGKAMGKAGYPFAVPVTEGKFGFTHCRGACYEPNTDPIQWKRATFGGEPTSKREIRVALVDRVVDPFDPAQSICIAGCDEKWNAFDARFISSYQSLYGQPAPALSKPEHVGTTSTINVIDVRKGEIHKIVNGKPYDACALQGCADDNWKETIAAIKITEIVPWRTPPTRKGFAETKVVGTYPLETDGSISITFPTCGFTYQLEGVNKDGVTVVKDNSLHSTICGETVTCHGCHEAHGEERRAAYTVPPEEDFSKTIAGQKQ
jgi:hypothetical protein